MLEAAGATFYNPDTAAREFRVKLPRNRPSNKQTDWLGRKAADFLREPSMSAWTLLLRPHSVEIQWPPYLKRQALREWKYESGM